MYRLAYNGDVVALKRAADRAAHFQRNPSGRGHMAVVFFALLA